MRQAPSGRSRPRGTTRASRPSSRPPACLSPIFFFNDTATTEIYTLPTRRSSDLTTTASRKAIDLIRRENKRDDKQEAQLVDDDDPPGPPGAIGGERLRLIATCCHPALAMQTRVALTLRMVAGLTVPEIARAFLAAETAIGQRITRAKAKIKAARIPYRVPSAGGPPGPRLRRAGRLVPRPQRGLPGDRPRHRSGTP